jgi:methyl-accepting chemotaxis protein
MKSIRSRLIAGLTLIILFFLAQAALVWWSQNTAKHEVVDATRKNTLASSELSQLAVLAQQVRRYEKEYFVYVGNEEKRNGYVKEWTDASNNITNLLRTMSANEGSAFTNSDLQAVANWTIASDFYSSEMLKIFDTVRSVNNTAAPAPDATPSAPVNANVATKTGSSAAATLATPATAATSNMLTPVQVNDMIKEGKTRFSDVLIKGVSAMSSEKTKATLALSDTANSSFEKLLFGVLLTVAVGVILSIFLMLTLPKAVTNPIAILTKSVENISKGNLDTKVDNGGIKEFDGLSIALERMRLGQQALVARMRRAAT